MLFLLKVNANDPSCLESAVGVCIRPTCPNELYDEPKRWYSLLLKFAFKEIEKIKKKKISLRYLSLFKTLSAVMLVAIALKIGAHIDATIAASWALTFRGT